MHEFEVWAPRVRALAVRVNSEEHPMQPAGGGWWKGYVENAGPGTDYSFIIDGDSLPDPRSRYQPNGVHGPSRV